MVARSRNFAEYTEDRVQRGDTENAKGGGCIDLRAGGTEIHHEYIYICLLSGNRGVRGSRGERVMVVSDGGGGDGGNRDDQEREKVRERADHEKQKTYGVCHEVCGREGCLQVSTLQQGVGEACHAGV